MRIAFLFNHDQVHQVAHGLPIALELAKLGTGAQVIVCSTNERISAEIRNLAGPAISGLQLVELRLKRQSSRLVDALAGGIIPASKLLLYRDNLDFFRSLDVLVVPEKTSLVLKHRFKLDRLKIIHVRHGAGDRAIGFNKTSAGFDHVLAAGPKIRDRLVAEAGVPTDRISIVGYPKLDLFPRTVPDTPASSGRPVVVYNPHVAPHLSSWYRSGRAILDWFVDHPEFELIFAPHIMLFERKLAVTIQPPRIGLPGSLPARVREAPNIRIDTGSRALTTMEYLHQADIYLGDASSQVYEFLITPRPCIFFDAHGFGWTSDKSFAHWRLGQVIDSVDQLAGALDVATTEHRERYRPMQEEMLRYTFDIADTPSSARAARAIIGVAKGSSSADPKSTTAS